MTVLTVERVVCCWLPDEAAWEAEVLVTVEVVPVLAFAVADVEALEERVELVPTLPDVPEAEVDALEERVEVEPVEALEVLVEDVEEEEEERPVRALEVLWVVVEELVAVVVLGRVEVVRDEDELTEEPERLDEELEDERLEEELEDERLEEELEDERLEEELEDERLEEELEDERLEEELDEDLEGEEDLEEELLEEELLEEEELDPLLDWAIRSVAGAVSATEATRSAESIVLIVFMSLSFNSCKDNIFQLPHENL